MYSPQGVGVATSTLASMIKSMNPHLPRRHPHNQSVAARQARAASYRVAANAAAAASGAPAPFASTTRAAPPVVGRTARVWSRVTTTLDAAYTALAIPKASTVIHLASVLIAVTVATRGLSVSSLRVGLFLTGGCIAGGAGVGILRSRGIVGASATRAKRNRARRQATSKGPARQPTRLPSGVDLTRLVRLSWIDVAPSVGLYFQTAAGPMSTFVAEGVSLGPGRVALEVPLPPGTTTTDVAARADEIADHFVDDLVVSLGRACDGLSIEVTDTPDGGRAGTWCVVTLDLVGVSGRSSAAARNTAFTPLVVARTATRRAADSSTVATATFATRRSDALRGVTVASGAAFRARKRHDAAATKASHAQRRRDAAAADVATTARLSALSATRYATAFAETSPAPGVVAHALTEASVAKLNADAAAATLHAAEVLLADASKSAGKTKSALTSAEAARTAAEAVRDATSDAPTHTPTLLHPKPSTPQSFGPKPTSSQSSSSTPPLPSTPLPSTPLPSTPPPSTPLPVLGRGARRRAEVSKALTIIATPSFATLDSRTRARLVWVTRGVRDQPATSIGAVWVSLFGNTPATTRRARERKARLAALRTRLASDEARARRRSAH